MPLNHKDFDLWCKKETKCEKHWKETTKLTLLFSDKHKLLLNLLKAESMISTHFLFNN